MIYENVKNRCDKLGISIRELERRAGISNGTISHWKTANPKIESLKAVAKVFGVNVDKLLN